MAYVTITKDIEIDLDDFETEELVEELSRRKADTTIPLDGAIAMLEREKAPTLLIEMLQDWNRLPVANPARLATWKQWAAQSAEQPSPSKEVTNGPVGL